MGIPALVPAVGIAIAAAVLALGARTDAQAAGWCALYHNGGTNCGFATMGQCQETVRGAGGHCGPDPSGGPTARERPSAPRQEARPRREPDKRPLAATPRSTPEARRDASAPPKPSASASIPEQAGQSQQQAVKAFATARALILSEKYEAGLAALRALGYDDHPDVAASIGYASSKLGRADDAKLWYEKALTADPNHVSALAYYGIWRVQHGDMIRAQGDLEKIKAICGGTTCTAYKELADAIASRGR
jgi:tetratricopeptide (TPR) repeat protein